MALKFRPAFSTQEIEYIIAICNLDKRPETAELAFTIASRLRVFTLKAQLGITAAAFVSTPRQSLEEKLGVHDPVEKRKRAYDLYLTNPALCSDEDIKLAMLYKYESNLMTKEEEAKYERDSGF